MKTSVTWEKKLIAALVALFIGIDREGDAAGAAAFPVQGVGTRGLAHACLRFLCPRIMDSASPSGKGIGVIGCIHNVNTNNP
jgi:hypothetical protein